MTASSNRLEYCQGGNDFAGMGVAVVGVWDCLENLPRVFGESSLDQLQAARQRILLRGFNSTILIRRSWPRMVLRLPRISPMTSCGSYGLRADLILTRMTTRRTVATA